jgi:hypothetical protein
LLLPDTLIGDPQLPQKRALGLSGLPHLVQKFMVIFYYILIYNVLKPHLPQNLAPGLNATPHCGQNFGVIMGDAGFGVSGNGHSGVFLPDCPFAGTSGVETDTGGMTGTLD